MPSPMPGMDPWLEDVSLWSGFHARIIVAIGANMTRLLPPGYYADLEQHVWLEDDDGNHESFAYPDGYVAERRGSPLPETDWAVATLPNTEVTLPKPRKKRTHKYIKIVDQPGNQIVTILEVLSPSNKENDADREAYLYKRGEIMLSGTNLVEIDLLRGGERLPMGRPTPPQGDYYALVSRADRFPKASIWSFTVRDPMPRLPIPLKPQDGQIVLDLRDCLDRAYDDGGYDRRIDYTQPPAIALRSPDALWAHQWINEHHP
ncbi:MAG: DUF4058 family protein [Bacteroidales bacterium]|nr:DUF4058 family protein [Bacteroidales bacterium]